MDPEEIKPSAQDYAFKLVKGAIGAVPFVGGLLGELLDIAIVPHQQRKLTEWFEYVDYTLNELLKSGTKSKEQIFNDEQFLSVFQKTSRIYVNNFEEQKKLLLQSYLKASIIKEIQIDKRDIFLKIIDELSQSQLLILKVIYENETSDKYLYQNKLEEILSEKFTNNDMQFLALLLKGLQDFNLLDYKSAEIVIDGVNQWHMRTSKISKDFFDYLLK